MGEFTSVLFERLDDHHGVPDEQNTIDDEAKPEERTCELEGRVLEQLKQHWSSCNKQGDLNCVEYFHFVVGEIIVNYLGTNVNKEFQ